MDRVRLSAPWGDAGHALELTIYDIADVKPRGDVLPNSVSLHVSHQSQSMPLDFGRGSTSLWVSDRN